MGLLRGAAHRQRTPGAAPRLGALLQGSLPPVPHDARPPCRPQGWLGLPRASRRARGRERAGHRVEARDRRSRHRRVQPPLPRIRAAVRRGLVGSHHPHRDVARRRQRLLDAVERLHRKRLVAVPPDVGARRHLRGLQGRPVLRTLRYRAVEPRGGTRLRRHHRAVRIRPVPRRRCRLRPARVDHDAVDARLERRVRGRAGHRVRAGARARRRSRSRHGGRARRAAVRGRRRRRVTSAGPRPARTALPAAVRIPSRRRRAAGRRRRLPHHRGRIRHRAPGARLR